MDKVTFKARDFGDIEAFDFCGNSIGKITGSPDDVTLNVSDTYWNSDELIAIAKKMKEIESDSNRD